MGKFRELVLLEREIEAIEANKLNATIASSILILLTEELNTKKHEFKEVALRLLKEFDEN